MNNEPVAWIKQNPETLQAELHFDKPAKYWATVISNPDIPLYTHPVSQYKAITNTKIEPTVVSYTHPVKEQDTECQYCKQGCIRCDARKQLTDEEITACMGFLPKYNSEIVDEDLVNFARAILRKAQDECK